MRPTDVPELRTELVRVLGGDVWRGVWRQVVARFGLFGEPASATAADWHLNLERKALSSAELFYVSSEMTDLAEAAGRTLPGFSLKEADLPAPFGLVVFDRPIAVHEEDGLPGMASSDVYTIAAMWATILSANNKRGVYVCFYTWAEANLAAAAEKGLTGAELPASMSRLTHDTEALIEFGAETTSESLAGTIFGEGSGSAGSQGRTLVSTWLLMQQPGMASSAHYEPTKLDRARAKRRRAPLEAVRVITLRHAAPAAAEGGEGRQYHHRWAVRGHWRNQWYPSREGHLPIWIAPHVKGPEGAPLKTGQKVYAWRR